MRYVYGVGIKRTLSDDPTDYFVDMIDFFTNREEARAFLAEVRAEYSDCECFYGIYLVENFHFLPALDFEEDEE